MNLLLIIPLFALSLFSFANQTNTIDQFRSVENSQAVADSTFNHNPPEGLEKTAPHFIVNGHKFWIIIDNKRSDLTYDKNTEIYQYYSQIPETLLQFNEDVTSATIVYKESKSTYAVIQLKRE